MGNDGKEVIIAVKGYKNPVKGLHLLIYQQNFPGTTLVRERLELLDPTNKVYTINKFNDSLYFIFPQYNLKTDENAKSIEIRIASFANELIEVNENISYDERFPDGKFNDHNLAYNHMFHPKIIEHKLTNEIHLLTKGPINVIKSKNIQWISTYEHASQDDLRGIFRDEVVEDGGLIQDAGQGIKGVFNFSTSSKDLHFLGFEQQRKKNCTQLGVRALRGAYLEGEKIDKKNPYSSVWTTTAFSKNTSIQRRNEILHEYMLKWICEKSASRKPEYYYNTWGMQRRIGGKFPEIRDIMNEENIIKEIKRAAELGIDIFVLDDGWEQAQGNWTPHDTRLPNGLTPIKTELDKLDIKLGVWLSPMGIDATTQRYKNHPEWVIKDSEGNAIKAQWDHPAIDFVSGFYDLFINDCKKLIDQGVRFFKWDAINTFYSSLPNLKHGSAKYSEDERRARYEYLLPIYVTRAMKELTDYEPELIIEIDITEARRVMVGLAPLSQGKLFWMNNGASGYNDYTVFRAKSMRSIPNQYTGIIPFELITYANYPQNNNKAQRYNVNSSLIAGHGFWGALAETDEKEREWIKKQVKKSKIVLPYISAIVPQVKGKIGASPEIYTMFDKENGAGQVIAFSGSATNYLHTIDVNPTKILGILNHAYNVDQNQLFLDFQFPMQDASREAFIIPNKDKDINIVSSSCWIDELEIFQKKLSYKTGAKGKQKILWSKHLGKPFWNENEAFTVTLQDVDGYFQLNVDVTESATIVEIYMK